MWNNSGPSNTNPRGVQISRLQHRFPNSKIVSPDNSIIDIPLMLRNGARFTFRLYLPSTFPTQPPTLRIQPPPSTPHPHVDPSGNVRHQRLQFWGAHFDLADTLSEIFNIFQTNPPLPSSSPSPSPSPSHSHSSPTHPYPYPNPSNPSPTYNSNPSPSLSHSSPSPSFSSSSSPTTTTTTTSHSPRIPQVPPIPSSFPELQSKSLDELRQLASDPHTLDQLVETLSWTAEMNRITDELTSKSTRMAEDNVQRTEEMREMQQKLSELRDTVSRLKPEVESLEQRQQRIMHQYSRESLLSHLNEKIQESEAITESMASEFTRQGSSVSIDSFVADYRNQRFQYHMRRLKKERFENQRGSSSSGGSSGGGMRVH